MKKQRDDGRVLKTESKEENSQKEVFTSDNEVKEIKKSSKRNLLLRITKIVVFVLFLVVFILLMMNSLLCIFVKHYYPTYGQYRLFAIVSDSMEGELEDSIPTGSMIVGSVPKTEDDIKVGTIITYEAKQGNSIVLITHRVIEINMDEETGTVFYTTKGDNVSRSDGIHPTFKDVVGIYTGNYCGSLGYIFGFLQSAQGTIALIIILLIVVVTFIIIHFVNLVNTWRNVALDALQKSATILNEIDNIDELGTLADVIKIVLKEPIDKNDIKRKDAKLKWFVKMNDLPKRPYPNDLEEYIKTMGDNLKPTPVPKLKYDRDSEEPEVESKEKTTSI